MTLKKKILISIIGFFLALILISGTIFYLIVRHYKYQYLSCKDSTYYTRIYDAINDRNKVCILYLENKDINYITSELFRMPKLRKLSYAHNSFTSFPLELTKLEKLESLDISYNNIGFVPPEIAKMKNLKDLNLSHTGISSLPDEIKNLPKLKIIDLSGNNFTSEPDVIKYYPRKLIINYIDNPFTKQM